MESQLEIPVIGEVRKIEQVPEILITKCKNRLDAVRLMINLSGLSNEIICEKSGIDPGHFSRILKGKASLPDDSRYTKIVDLCGNNAPLQWEAMTFGFSLLPKTQARIIELEEELSTLRQAQ